jgi:hypothetical protein
MHRAFRWHVRGIDDCSRQFLFDVVAARNAGRASHGGHWGAAIAAGTHGTRRTIRFGRRAGGGPIATGGGGIATTSDNLSGGGDNGDEQDEGFLSKGKSTHIFEFARFTFPGQPISREAVLVNVDSFCRDA